MSIDHAANKWPTACKRLTDGRGVDLVFDHVAGKQFSDGLKLLAPLGMIVSYGLLGGMPDGDLFAAMRGELDRSPAVRCFTMHTYDHMPERRREAMAAVIDLYGRGAFRPAIGATFRLAEAARAHDLIESRQAMGKLMLKP